MSRNLPSRLRRLETAQRLIQCKLAEREPSPAEILSERRWKRLARDGHIEKPESHREDPTGVAPQNLADYMRSMRFRQCTAAAQP